MFQKIFGLSLFVIGFVIFTRFSFIIEYEKPFTKTGMIIGIIICLIGLILMVS